MRSWLRSSVISTLVLAMVVPTGAWATPSAPHSVPQTLDARAVVPIPHDHVIVTPGQRTFALASGVSPSVVGHFEFTAPSRTTITGIQHQEAGVLAYTLSEDGRTARTVRSNVPLGPKGYFMRMTIDDDAPLGAILDGGSMRVVSPAGELLAEGTFSLEVLAAPTVLDPPVDVDALEHEDATFSADFGGQVASVRWQVSTDGGDSFVDVPGATTTTLHLEGVTREMDGWQYRSVATNAVAPEGVETPAATLRVQPVDVVQHPVDLTAREGEVARFSVTVWPTEDAVLGWEQSTDGGTTWTESTRAPQEVPGREATDADLVLEAGVNAGDDGTLVKAYLRYPGDRVVWSDEARLTVDPADVTVAEGPSDAIVFEGHEATFSAQHGGTSFPVTAQWQVSTDGGVTFDDVPGATGHSFVIDAASLEMNGWQYRVLFSNGPSSALSDPPATLTVHPTPPAAHLQVTPRVTFVDSLPR